MKNPILSAEQHTALRLKACGIVSELGACLDALHGVAQEQTLPGPRAERVVVIHSSLEDAFSAIEMLEGYAADAKVVIGELMARADFLAAVQDDAGVKGGAK